MKDYDLTKFIKGIQTIDILEIPEFESLEEAEKELEAAEKALFYYKKVTPLICAADVLSDQIGPHLDEYDLIYEIDCVDHMFYGTVDIVHILKNHLFQMHARMNKYCEDIEDVIMRMSPHKKYAILEKKGK